MTSNVVGQGVGLELLPKVAQADDNSKSVIENALKKTFAHLLKQN
jgi:ATP-dependent Clp protease ATP-binding subunit ClpC